MTREEEMAEKRKVLMLNPKNSPKWLIDSNRAHESLQKMRKAEKKGNRADVKKYSNIHVDQVMRNNKNHAEYKFLTPPKKINYHTPRGETPSGAGSKWERFCGYCENGLYNSEINVCCSCAVDLAELRCVWLTSPFSNAMRGK